MTTAFLLQQHREQLKKEEEAKKEKLVKEHPLIPREERSYGAPTQLRPSLSDGYQHAITGREDWWRHTLKNTPVPGTYDVPDQDNFLLDLDRKPTTYGFKNEGRKCDAMPHIGKGSLLLPGAYKYEDFATRVSKHNKITYSFKNTSRDQRDAMNFGRKDKDINVPPNAYEIHGADSLSSEQAAASQAIFKSQSRRFPTIHFVPKIGPPPGSYEYNPPKALHVVSSSFKSATPRFRTSHSKTPGPGWYEKTYRPASPEIKNMGRHFGLFFSPQYNSILGAK